MRHVLDLFDLSGKVIDHFLHVLELAGQFCSFLTRSSQLFYQIGVLLRCSLDLLVSSSNGAVCLAIYVLDLSVDVADVSLNLVDSAEGVVVAFVLRHEFEVYLIESCHLLLIEVSV